MNLNHAAALVLHLIMILVNMVFAVFAAIELWLRHLLGQLGIGGTVATAVLILVAIAFFIGALRLFGGVLQVLILLFVVLFGLQLLFTIVPA